MKVVRIEPRFVDSVPEQLDNGVLYISQKYSTAIHKCCCGCGEEVVTPLTPVDWKIKIDGKYVTLTPSIGNWNFPCKSHYWIDKNHVIWAEEFTAARIAYVKYKDKRDKEKYIAKKNAANLAQKVECNTVWTRVWRKIKSWLN